LELARRARDGDESAFEEIMRRYSPRVFRFASRFFRQRSLVEEAAQEVFLKAFTELGKFEGRGSMEGWLTRITTNTCLNMLRSSKRRPELTTSDLSEDESNWLESKMAHGATEIYQASERSAIAADLAGVFRTRDLAAWLEHFGDEDVCVGPVWTREEAAAIFGSREAPVEVPLGAHTEAWRRELGVDEA